MSFLLLVGLHFLAISTHADQIYSLSNNSRKADDVLQWPTRTKRSPPAVWGAPVPDYSNVVAGPVVYLYTILFIDLKTVEHYSNDMSRVATEVVKLVRESNKYFYQLNIRVVVVDVLPTHRNDLSLYSFEDFHNAHTSLPYHNFAVLTSFRYAGGLAFVSGFCTSKNVMMVGFYPHNPHAMASIFFHEVTHLIGVSHTHANESLDVPNCPCNSVSFVPKSNAQSTNQTGESLLSSTTRHVEGCLKIPGFDHNCTAQLAVNLLHRSRCLSNMQRTDALNRAEGYTIETKVRLEYLSICGNGVVETNEECDCGLPKYCSEWNCEALICQRKVPIWVMALSGTGLAVVFLTFLVFYGLRLASCSEKQYSAVETKMIGSVATHLDYTAIVTQLVRQFSRLYQSLKSLLCRRKLTRTHEGVISGRNTLDSQSIVVIQNAQQQAGNPAKPSTTKLERPRFPPPSLPVVARPRAPPPPRPDPPQILKNYSQLEQNITYKFSDFEDDD